MITISIRKHHEGNEPTKFNIDIYWETICILAVALVGMVSLLLAYVAS